jgi:hypothetical protein
VSFPRTAVHRHNTRYEAIYERHASLTRTSTIPSIPNTQVRRMASNAELSNTQNSAIPAHSKHKPPNLLTSQPSTPKSQASTMLSYAAASQITPTQARSQLGKRKLGVHAGDIDFNDVPKRAAPKPVGLCPTIVCRTADSHASYLHSQ